ncbi:MAG: hypothetical protein FWE67_16185 [Planctomycetaceae bacterium]|nr:hypothetical protein [Planctomycetaceae bacterium]
MSEPADDLDCLTRDELIAEVKRLQKTVKLLQKIGTALKGVRKQSETTLLGLPLVSIAHGPDLEKGESVGHAKGIIAIGDIATGVLALGGAAFGGITIGGFSVGLISVGGFALSLLLAMGGFALGTIALGGFAAGGVAVGGVAIGYYALGGSAFGVHVINAMQQSPEAVRFFDWFIPGLGEMFKPK